MKKEIRGNGTDTNTRLTPTPNTGKCCHLYSAERRTALAHMQSGKKNITEKNRKHPYKKHSNPNVLFIQKIKLLNDAIELTVLWQPIAWQLPMRMAHDVLTHSSVRRDLLVLRHAQATPEVGQVGRGVAAGGGGSFGAAAARDCLLGKRAEYRHTLCVAAPVWAVVSLACCVYLQCTGVYI